jgi:hypothetical protein
MTTRRAIQLHGIALLAAADSLVVHHLRPSDLGRVDSEEGRALDEGSFEGSAEIRRKRVGTCSSASIISGAAISGTCERRGDEFEVRWHRSRTQGRAHYTLSSTEVLHGTWSLDEGSHLGLETLTPNNNP